MALTYVFVNECQSTWFAYPIYTFSAYITVVICIWFCQLCKHSRQRIDGVLNRVPLVQRYFSDIAFNMHVSLYCSVTLNALYAIMEFAFSIYFRSFWFGTLAIYYLLLVAIRYALLRHANTNTFGMNMKLEWKRYRMCGVVLLLINFALAGVLIMITQGNDEAFPYPEYLIYVKAMYAFYSVISAVFSVLKYRKYNSPVVSAAKVLQLATAIVSMLSLETAMLAQFGANESEEFHNIMTGATGGGVCAAIVAIAIYMIFTSTKKIKAFSQEELQ